MADLRLLLPRTIRRLPADLTAAVALVVLADVAALAPVVRETPLRVVGRPVVLFVPGYVLVTALFPEAGEGQARSRTRLLPRASRIGSTSRSPTSTGHSRTTTTIPTRWTGTSCGSARRTDRR